MWLRIWGDGDSDDVEFYEVHPEPIPEEPVIPHLPPIPAVAITPVLDPPVNEGRRTSARASKPVIRYGFLAFIGSGSQLLTDEPQSVREALSRPDAEEWKKSMASEYTSLVKTQTFKVVPRPKGQIVLDCRWVFKNQEKSRWNY